MTCCTAALLVQLDIVGGEEARVALVVAKPPVVVGELEICNLRVLGE